MEANIHTEYTLGLALFDFIPVFLSVTGLFLAARWMQGGFSITKSAWVGALIASLGGLSKASWKLIVVVTGTNIEWMDNALFPLLGTGFALLFITLIMRLFDRDKWIWPIALAIILLFYVWSWTKLGSDDPGSWSLILLIMTAGFSTLFSLTLSGLSIARRKFLAAIAILISVGGAFYLAKLAQIPEQTLALQWKEEIINTFSQGLFLIGIISLSSTMFTRRKS